MPPVTIYTTSVCPYCHAAKRLLRQKAVAFDEIDLTNNWEGRQALVGKADGSSTVPQIWIGERHVGGCDDLYALEAAGELDRLLHG
ncbi:MAG: glutaredoxin 3 [Hyphomicrobiales bacterium]|nr:glutaredoxin 3 [Hyphomicrobiales bacterium]